jgi:hypothetical protein
MVGSLAATRSRFFEADGLMLTLTAVSPALDDHRSQLS